MKRLINALRVGWLYVRRDIAKAELRDMAQQGVIAGQMLDEYRRQVSEYDAAIAEIQCSGESCRQGCEAQQSESKPQPLHKQLTVAAGLVALAAILVIAMRGGAQ